jgi:hypothetical protein
VKVTRYMVLVGAVLACPLFGGHAAAQNIDGGTLFADCREGDDPNARDRLFKQGNCFGYILGVADALRPAVVFCIPSGTTVGQIVDVAKLYLIEHPEARKKLAPHFVVSALAEKFPCN